MVGNVEVDGLTTSLYRLRLPDDKPICNVLPIGMRVRVEWMRVSGCCHEVDKYSTDRPGTDHVSTDPPSDQALFYSRPRNFALKRISAFPSSFLPFLFAPIPQNISISESCGSGVRDIKECMSEYCVLRIIRYCRC